MKPPFIVIDGLDVSIFKTKEAMENKLEAIDVNSNLYEVFDSEGRSIVLESYNKSTSGERDYSKGEIELVRIKSVEEAPEHEFNLKLKLLDYLNACQPTHSREIATFNINQINTIPLGRVIKACIDIAGFTI